MMTKVKIGEKEVPMLSMASVDVYYRQLFHEDPAKLQTSDNFGGTRAINFVFQMGFIMAMRAVKTKQEMNALTEDDYFDWLDGLDRGGLYDSIDKIMAVYDGQKRTDSSAKKNGGR